MVPPAIIFSLTKSVLFCACVCGGRVAGGMVLETNMTSILQAVTDMDKLDRSRADSSTVVTVGAGGTGNM